MISPVNESKGCGGVMRVAPIGLMREFTVGQAFVLGARAAAQTHGHADGYLPAGVMAALVHGLVEGMDLTAAASQALLALQAVRSLREWPHSGRTQDALLAAESAGTGDPSASVRSLGEGWVGEEALAIGYYAARVADGYAEAIQIAANHDGDSDSTASIAGQIVGAWFGAGAIPWGWEEGVDCGAELSEMARELTG